MLARILMDGMRTPFTLYKRLILRLLFSSSSQLFDQCRNALEEYTLSSHKDENMTMESFNFRLRGKTILLFEDPSTDVRIYPSVLLTIHTVGCSVYL